MHKSEALTEPEADNEKQVPSNSSEPPDGGLHAWLTVLGAALVSFSTFGIVNAYGAFSDFYRSSYINNESPTLISMVGSIQVFVLYFFGAFVGPIFDAYGPKYLIPASGLTVTLALCLLSITPPHRIFSQFLTQSVLFNLGAAFGFYPSISIITHWFKKRTAYALGCVIGGASAGGIVFPIMLHKLLPKIGFGWTVRACALVVAFCYSCAIVTIRARRPPKPLPPIKVFLDFAAFKDPRYAIFAVGAWFNIVSVFNPFFQVGAYGIVANGASPVTPYLLTIMCATSIFGRVLPGIVADKLGRFNTIAASTTISSILTLSVWYTSTKQVNIVVFAAFYGFTSGPFFSLMPACVSQISPIDRIGARIGMLFAFLSFGALAGTPIGGVFIRDTTIENFRHLILYTVRFSPLLLLC
ncbi:major facilitator superfamily domain-containing protein [Crucibulum laeve]|uniref:Major facilitator superfamily domain-containing protein n=1 Tax=Crucibulum laeve TaxID=68775 RepID=A0A5C3LWM2_9AGAR|nr:major facilitator superfamily domain-containing protein [Crucibulum laeve]